MVIFSKYFNSFAYFRKFDNFSRFFRDNTAEIYRSEFPNDGKDVFKMNSLAVIFEKSKKMSKIADFVHSERVWSLYASFVRHPVHGKMMDI